MVGGSFSLAAALLLLTLLLQWKGHSHADESCDSTEPALKNDDSDTAVSTRQRQRKQQKQPPDFFTFYDFAPEIQANWSFGLSPSLPTILAAHRTFGLPSMFGDLVHSCLVSPTPGCNDTAGSHYKVIRSGIIDRGNFLDPDWERNTERLAAKLKPLIMSGVVLGVFIGDELTCCGKTKLPFSNLTALASKLRAALGPAVGWIYTNDGPGTEGNGWPYIPPGLDLLSFDLYDARQGRHFEVTEVQAALAVIKPKLHPHQRMVLVPGVFASHHESSGSGDRCPPSIPTNITWIQDNILSKLDAYWDWISKGDPDHFIAGFNPWHLLNRSVFQGDKGCDDEIGAIALPRVMAKLKTMGKAIMANRERQAASVLGERLRHK